MIYDPELEEECNKELEDLENNKERLISEYMNSNGGDLEFAISAYDADRESIISFYHNKDNGFKKAITSPKAILMNEIQELTREIEQIKPKRDKKKSIKTLYSEIEETLNKKYKFRRNIIKDQVEYHEVNSEEWLNVDDIVENSILRNTLIDYNTQMHDTTKILKNILGSDWVTKCDPFMEYLNSLPPWDGTTDYISALANTVTVIDEDKKIWIEYFKKWFVGMLAQMDHNIKHMNHITLILAGAQGKGKTTWLNRLVFNSDYRHTGLLPTNIKDAQFVVSDNQLVNLDEFDGVANQQESLIKSLMTKDQIKERRPYDKRARIYLRRASFCGSLNDPKVLSDYTGNRRYLIIRNLSITNDYDESIKIGAYSQAKALVDNKWEYYLSDDENEFLSLRNKIFQKVNQTEDILFTIFGKPEDYPNKPVEHKNAGEIINIIKTKYSWYNISPENLGRILISNFGEPTNIKLPGEKDSRKRYKIVSLDT